MLVVIPARGGSKGLPGKNIRLFCGKPLIYYSIDVARQLVDDVNICISTDDVEIKHAVEKYGLEVPFLRPAILASDTATTNDVLIHAINYYEFKGRSYDVIILLQPTSPLRTIQHVKEAISLYDENCDMVVSVKESHSATVLCHENLNGFLQNSLVDTTRRQDAPAYYEYNGAVYVINVNSLFTKGLNKFNKKKKYIMPSNSSIDIDNENDFVLAEFLMSIKK